MSSIADQGYNIKKATVYCLLYSLLLGIMTLLGKMIISTHATNSMAVFFRFSVSLLYIMTIFSVQYLRGRRFPIVTKNFKMHVLRAGASVACNACIFYAIKYTSLANVSLLFMTSSLFIPILGAIFLAIVTTKENWLAIIIGFFGVALVLKPGHAMLNPAALVALASGFFAAVSFLGVHELGKVDKPYTIMLYYFGLSFLFSSVITIFNWQTPDIRSLLGLFGVGVIGTLSQECAIRALVNAPAKIVAPLMYSSIVFSGILDWFFWHTVPDLLSVMGAVIICIGSTLTVIYAQDRVQKVEKVNIG